MAEAGEQGVGGHIKNLPPLAALPLGGQRIAQFEPLLLAPIDDEELDGHVPLPVAPDRREHSLLIRAERSCGPSEQAVDEFIALPGPSREPLLGGLAILGVVASGLIPLGLGEPDASVGESPVDGADGSVLLGQCLDEPLDDAIHPPRLDPCGSQSLGIESEAMQQGLQFRRSGPAIGQSGGLCPLLIEERVDRDQHSCKQPDRDDEGDVGAARS